MQRVVRAAGVGEEIRQACSLRLDGRQSAGARLGSPFFAAQRSQRQNAGKQGVWELFHRPWRRSEGKGDFKPLGLLC